MTVLLVQLDGKLPSVALMRLAAHFRALGWRIVFVAAPGPGAFDRGLWDSDEPEPDAVFGSLIFTWTQPLARRLLERFPGAVVGGTGWDLGKPPEERTTLEKLGVGLVQDYSLYPRFLSSIGYTMRGCRMTKAVCGFCDVPLAEGRPRAEQDVADLWRGEPYPRHLLLLDNDFGGGPRWREHAAVMREGGFKVCFSQGLNARLVTDEVAETVAGLDYKDDAFKARRLYCAWDNKSHEKIVFAGLDRLVRYGVQPDEIMVYMLVGYWPGETEADRLYRHDKLADFGCRVFPMAFRGVSGKPDKHIMGFTRWAIRRVDHSVSWETWKEARYQVRNLRESAQTEMFPKEE